MPEKRRAKTPEKPVEIDSRLSVFFKKNNKAIIFTGVLIAIIIIIYIFYSYQINQSEYNAWEALSVFRGTHTDTRSIGMTDIQGLLDKTEGSSAEPWILYYSYTVFMSKGDLDNAQKMINNLQSKYPDHYLCKNRTPLNSNSLLESSKSFLDKELNWKTSYSNL